LVGVAAEDGTDFIELAGGEIAHGWGNFSLAKGVGEGRVPASGTRRYSTLRLQE
jgi:hypothetical protein